MRTRWLVPFTISLGLSSALGIAACKNDDGGEDQADGGSESESDASTTETSTTNGTTETDDTTTDDTDTTTGCTPGELGCDCNNGLCLGDLECVAGTCVSSECIPGELGCECNNDLCLGDLVCNNGICSDPNCTPGELACECNNGLCLGELVCENDVCVVGGDTDTDTTDTTDTDMECPNANEKMCDGECVDVLSNNDNCGDCGVTCKVYTVPDPDVGTCQDGACSPTFSECVAQSDGYVNCDQICALEGKTCVEDGCNGFTTIQGGLPACMNAGFSTANSSQACGANISWNTSYGACCCAQ